MKIASFDIGKKNFSFCIEEFDEKLLEELGKNSECNSELHSEYNENGTPTEKTREILSSIYSNGKILLHKNVDLTTDCDAKLKLDPKTFLNLTKLLDEHSSDFEECSYIIIEQQMSFGSKLNLTALKLAQHCYSYFIIKYNNKKVIDYPAYYKTQVLGAPKQQGKPYKNGRERFKSMSKPLRKKWAIKKAIEILENRNEIEILNKIKSVKKKDDLADCLIQLQSAKYLIFIKRIF